MRDDVDVRIASDAGAGEMAAILQRHAAGMALAESLLAERRRYRDEAILEAVAGGWTYRQIAVWVGVTIGWIAVLVEKSRTTREKLKTGPTDKAVAP